MTASTSPIDRSRFPLTGLTVGVSVSDVPEPDLAARGLGAMHVDHAFWELTRHLLSLGANVACGGDHRVGGYTQRLFDLVRTYPRDDVDPTTRVTNYLAWPIHHAMKAADRNRVKDVCTLVDCPLPDDVKDDPAVQALPPREFLKPDPAANRRIWMRSLTVMREEMNAAIDARVFLGGRYGGIIDGRLDRFTGKYPGLVEEAHLAITSNKPTFLLAGFGGCTHVIAEALTGGTPAPLTLDFHTTADPVYREVVEQHSLHPDTPIDYEGIRGDFQSAGIPGLNNRLSESDNQRLFKKDDIDELLALTIAGLRRIASK